MVLYRIGSKSIQDRTITYEQASPI